MSQTPIAMKAIEAPAPARAPLAAWTPRLVVAPSAIASFVYVFVFTAWTLYISMSNSSLLPTYGFVGLKPLFRLVVEPALDDRLRQPLLL